MIWKNWHDCFLDRNENLMEEQEMLTNVNECKHKGEHPQ